MNTSILEITNAILSSRRFSAFFNGVDFKLPNGKIVTLKLETVFKRNQPKGLRFVSSPYIARMTTSRGHVSYGYGESDYPLLSIQKSIAEAVERSVFLLTKVPGEIQNSNGWAAHLTQEKARTAARKELLERDAVLVHWLTKTPLVEIENSTLPKSITHFEKNELLHEKEFNRLKVLISTKGFSPTSTVMLMNQYQRGFISHASGSTLEGAVTQALSEVTRIASDFKRLNSKLDQIETPWDHAIAYIENKIPDWIFDGSISFKEANFKWKNHVQNFPTHLKTNFSDYQCGDLYISHCKSENVQNLFFGETVKSKEKINFKRLEDVSEDFILNLQPHFVP